MKSLIFVVILFLYFFSIPIVGLPINTSKIVVIAVLAYYLISHNKLSYNKYFTYPLFFCIFLFLFSAFFSWFHKTNDYSIPYAFFIMAFEGIIGSWLIINIFSTKIKGDFLKYIIIILFIQSIIIFLMFLSPSIKDFFYNLSKDKDNLQNLYDRYEGGYRGLGFASGTVFDMAIVFGIGILLCFYNFEKNKSLLYPVFVIFFLIAGAMAGRVILVPLIFVVLFVIRFYSLKKKLLYKAFITLGILSICFYFLYQERTQLFLDFALEPFKNYKETGEFSTHSSKAMNNMFENGITDMDLHTFLLGDGYYRNPFYEGRYYKDIDIGYLRNIFFFGFFGMILTLGFYFFLLKKMKGVLKENGEKELLFLTNFIFIVYLISHYKGDILISGVLAIKFILLYYFYIVNIKAYERF